MIIFLKNAISAPIISFFKEKVRKLWTWEKLKKMMKKECFSDGKNDFIFLKGFFTKMGRRKICRWYPAVLLQFLVFICFQRKDCVLWNSQIDFPHFWWTSQLGKWKAWWRCKTLNLKTKRRGRYNGQKFQFFPPGQLSDFLKRAA